MNSINIIGRLGRDPEKRFTSGGTAVANFTIAVDDGFGEKKTTNWFQVTAWSKTAEFVDQYFKKGSKIAITGRLQEQTWQDKNSGEKRSKVLIVAERVSFVDSKNSQTEREPGDDSFNPEQTQDEESGF